MIVLQVRCALTQDVVAGSFGGPAPSAMASKNLKDRWSSAYMLGAHFN